MSDRAYFQALLDTAKDPMMQAFYTYAVNQRGGVQCQHPDKLVYFDRSYGILYTWQVCSDCDIEMDHRRLDGHD